MAWVPEANACAIFWPARVPSASNMRYDAIIVGGSYAGMAAALQLARARRSVLVIDAGQCRNRFASRSHGFLGNHVTRTYRVPLLCGVACLGAHQWKSAAITSCILPCAF
jgi:choline dehydrogenase-like flavoprotein